MKTINHLLIFVTILLLASCDKDEENLFRNTGMVTEIPGSNNCGVLIKLDNGATIQPLFYPEHSNFSLGKRVYVEYVELQNVISGCKEGTLCEIKTIEELGCTPVMGLTELSEDKFKGNDPVMVQQVKAEKNCLYITVSFSGGCRNHNVALIATKPLAADDMSIPVLEIRHNANNDMCEALLTKEYGFDLSVLKSFNKNKIIIRSKQPSGIYRENTVEI